jgi:hypothetical protein
MATATTKKLSWFGRQPVGVRAALIGASGAIVAALLAAVVTLL